MKLIDRISPMIFLLGSCCISLVSCSILGGNGSSLGDGFKDFTGIGKDGAAKGAGHKDLSSIAPTARADMSKLYSEDDIVWADEDPDVAMDELDALWKKAPKDSWYESYDEAFRVSRKEGKPVLIWFTNSRNNANSKALSNEVFTSSKFDDWARDHVVLIRIDSNVRDNDEKRKTLKRDYVAKLRKRYKVLGAPVVLMLSPRGTQFAKYNGYKSGNGEFYLGRLKSGHRLALADYASWREEYEAKGYRVWHDYKGRKVFAKPYSLKDGVLYLKDPEGKRSKTSLKKLSAEDQQWVQSYVLKKKR